MYVMENVLVYKFVEMNGFAGKNSNRVDICLIILLFPWKQWKVEHMEMIVQQLSFCTPHFEWIEISWQPCSSIQRVYACLKADFLILLQSNIRRFRMCSWRQTLSMGRRCQMLTEGDRNYVAWAPISLISRSWPTDAFPMIYTPVFMVYPGKTIQMW